MSIYVLSGLIPWTSPVFSGRRLSILQLRQHLFHRRHWIIGRSPKPTRLRWTSGSSPGRSTGGCIFQLKIRSSRLQVASFHLKSDQKKQKINKPQILEFAGFRAQSLMIAVLQIQMFPPWSRTWAGRRDVGQSLSHCDPLWFSLGVLLTIPVT